MGGAPPLPHDFAPQGSKNGPFLAGFRPEDQGPGGGLRTPENRGWRGSGGPRPRPGSDPPIPGPAWGGLGGSPVVSDGWPEEEATPKRQLTPS